MTRWLLVLLLGCGRVGFEPQQEAGVAGTSGDAAGASACMAVTMPGCALLGTSSIGNGLMTGVGTCGGSPDVVVSSGVPQTVELKVVNSTYDATLQVWTGDMCSGAPTGCADTPGNGGDTVDVAMVPGQDYTVRVTAAAGGCGQAQLQLTSL